LSEVRNMNTKVRWATRLALALLAAGARPPAALAQPAGIDPQATAILKRSMDFLAGLKAFSVDAHSTIEATLISGQKLLNQIVQ
jgi:hypothetical protein